MAGTSGLVAGMSILKGNKSGASWYVENLEWPVPIYIESGQESTSAKCLRESLLIQVLSLSTSLCSIAPIKS